MAVMQSQPPVATVSVRPRRTLGWGLTVVAAALLAWQGAGAFADAEQLRSQREGLASLARAAAVRAGAMSSEERTRHAQIEAVANALASPATTLLDALEAQAGSGVTLTRIAHDASTATLELDARAPSGAARVRYLRDLSAVPRVRGLWAVDAVDRPAEAGRAQPFRIAARWPEPRVP